MNIYGQVHLDAQSEYNDDRLLSPQVNIVASVYRRKLFGDDAFSMECISDCKNNFLATLCGKMNDAQQTALVMDERCTLLTTALVDIHNWLIKLT